MCTPPTVHSSPNIVIVFKGALESTFQLVIELGLGVLI